jgi:chaperonin GroES
MANKAKKKPVKKSVAKKSPSKKAAKSNVKKVAKKVVAKKAVKKAVTKATAKTAKSVKPVNKIATTKSALKPALKNAKPVAKKSIDYTKAITPLADRLVIRVVQGEKVTTGGIIIPDMVSAAIGHLKGEVLAVGHGAKNKKGSIRPLDVQIGDHVLFQEFAGTKIEFNSEELQIIHESDVMGIVQN